MATAKQIKARELFAKRAKAGAFARKGKRAKNPTKKFPSEMTAAEINKALDKLDAEYSKLTDKLIAAGRGHERIGDIVRQKDSLSYEVVDNVDRRMQLRAEIDRRYGPGAPSRLPTHKRGAFGPRRANPATPEKAELKMKIRGSETLDFPEGNIVTEKQALAWAKKNMPADLKRAGFVASVYPGARGWSINYGASVPGHSSYRNSNPATPEYDDNPTGTGNIILDQLGGHRFIAMTGAKNFVSDGSGWLRFKLPKNASNANLVTIKLTPDDLYHVEFSKYSPSSGNVKILSESDGVYSENLRGVFERATGLYTSLGTMGRERNPLTPEVFAMPKANAPAFSYFVRVRADESKPWRVIAGFLDSASAKRAAKALADANPKLWVSMVNGR